MGVAYPLDDKDHERSADADAVARGRNERDDATRCDAEVDDDDASDKAANLALDLDASEESMAR